MYEIIFNSQDHHLLCLRLITSNIKNREDWLHCTAALSSLCNPLTLDSGLGEICSKNSMNKQVRVLFEWLYI